MTRNILLLLSLVLFSKNIFAQIVPQKMVLLERFDGEWCGYCPDGDLKSQEVADSFPNRVIQISYHDGDPFLTDETYSFENFFHVTGFPSGLVDRYKFNNEPEVIVWRENWMERTAERLNEIVPADVVVSNYAFNSLTRNFSVTVATNFYTSASDAFQLDLVITEDSVYSVAQHNYYNVPGAVNPDNPALNNIGDPIENWYHMNVERDILNAPSSTIPDSIPSSGGTYSYTFNGTLDTSWNEDHINFIGVLHKNSTDSNNCQVINCSMLNTSTVTCSAGFYLVADTIVPHHYWGVNTSSGAQPQQYIWNWGDGTADTSAYPSHTYDSAGYYTICLDMLDSTGCFDSICLPYDIQKLTEENTIVSVDIVESIPDSVSAIGIIDPLQSLSVFPNPASIGTTVRFSLANPCKVSIGIYDVLGNSLEQISTQEDAGEHDLRISTEKLQSGVYFLKINAGNQGVLRKIVVIR